MHQVATVAKYLSWMQKIFLSWLCMGLAIGFLAGAGATPPDLLMIPIGLTIMVTGILILVCTYRCASGTGRSGVLWLLGVIVFKLIALIILSFLTRKWLSKQGVKVHSLGLGYTLPAEDPIVEDSLGFSRV